MLLSILFSLFSIAAGVLPTVIYVLLVWRIDRHEKEPLKLLVAAFLWGSIPAVLLSAFVELVLDASIVSLSQGHSEFLGASLVAPPVEEILKGVALLGIFGLARYEFDGVLDGIVYGSIIGFGFAMIENIFYFWGAQQEGGLIAWGVVVLGRALAFGFNHALFTSLTGIGFGLARYARSCTKRWGLVLLGLLASIIAHSVHNSLTTSGLCLISLVLNWSGLLVILLIVFLTWRRERGWITTHLADEVSLGVLTQAQFEAIASRQQRFKVEWRALGSSGLHKARLWRKLAAAATGLAFKKHQLSLMGNEKRNEAIIGELRHRVAHLGQLLGDEA
jgi:RsiW-degrading membrane proteinase PrsW (M82 family)